MASRPERAVILAAGRGSRLGAATAERPKCLVPLAGRPLLEWQIAALRVAGIRELAAVVGYRGEQVQGYPLRCFENPRWRTSSMVASLLCAREWLREAPCLVVYGDVAFHPAIAEELAACTADLAIAVDTAWRDLWRLRFARPEEDAESLRLAGDRVVEIGRRVADVADVDAQFMGLLSLTPAAWRDVERLCGALEDAALARLETTHLLQRRIAAGGEVRAVRVAGRWCEVDRPEDLAAYERALAAERPWSHDFRFPVVERAPASGPGRVFWITGLAGAGKTTVASALAARLRDAGVAVAVLDGDEVRAALGHDLGYSEDDRRRCARRYAGLARMLASQGLDVVVATISMFEDVRGWCRGRVPRYVEVHLRAPLPVRARRTPRAVASPAAADLGAGCREPERPDLCLDDDGSLAPHAAVARILEVARAR